MDNNFFKRSNKEYKVLVKPVTGILHQYATYLTKINNKPYRENYKIVKKILKKEKIRNPEIKYHYRNKNGDKEIRHDKVTDYLKEIYDNDEVIAPSFTSYISSDEEKSLHAEFLFNNIKLRSSDKKNAFKYKQLGDKDKALYYNTLQKTRKIFNNSLSGAYASKSTILFNPSAHYTLTSITRCVASIGNSVTESMIAGNKHFRNPDIVMNYIVSVISEVDIEHMTVIINKYNLHVPTAKEVMDMILFSSKNYWEDKEKEEFIFDFLKKLNGIELASILYVNDMFHFRRYNDEMARDLIKGMSRRLTTGSTDPIKDIENASDGIMNLVHHICSQDIIGMEIDYRKLLEDGNIELLTILGSTAKGIHETLVKYRDFFRTFYTTDILPVSISYLRDMLRDAIVLSDTDSTCGAYDNWVQWYFGELIFSNEAIGVSAAVMTINTQVIDHNLKLLAKNLNIKEDLVDLLKMKNEFFWDVFTSTNVSKHYYANVRIQEGNVFETPDLEIKGVHLIASNVNAHVREVAYQTIKDIHNTITSNKKLKIYDIVERTAKLERKLIEDIKNDKIDIFKTEKIKSDTSYKLEKEKSPYLHHMLWESVFKDKYSTPGEPPYMVIKIPTTLKSKKTMKEYLDNIDDKDIKENMEKFLTKHNKDNIQTFRVPLMIAGERGIPKEIKQAINFKRVIFDNLNIMYLILESIGFYRKADMTLTEMGY